HRYSWQSLPPSLGTAFPHRGQVMQVLSAPSSPRTFSFVNTAGAVPGKASVARNIARSRSLREPGFLVIVAPCRFSNRGPPGVTSGLVMYVMLPTGYLRHWLQQTNIWRR